MANESDLSQRDLVWHDRGRGNRGSGPGCGGEGLYACGTVFSVDPATGTETVLYSFCSEQDCPDGATPNSGLVAIDGKLYGTTYVGGSFGYGAVFALDPGTGAETVIHSFQGLTDPRGSIPAGSMIDWKGKLYGATLKGGTYGLGILLKWIRPVERSRCFIPSAAAATAQRPMEDSFPYRPRSTARRLETIIGAKATAMAAARSSPGNHRRGARCRIAGFRR